MYEEFWGGLALGIMMPALLVIIVGCLDIVFNFIKGIFK